MTLSRAARRFQVVRPGPNDEQLRFTVSADSGPHVETLTFSFPTVTPDEATLRLQWAGTVVPIRIQVQSARTAVTAAHALSSYAGVYEFRYVDDSTGPVSRYEVTQRGTSLWVRTTGEAVEKGLDQEFDLVPAGGGTWRTATPPS